MVVHEALPPIEQASSGAAIEHDFATREEPRSEKDLRYALLWALQTRKANKRVKAHVTQRIAHFVRDAFVGGALFQGGPGAAAMVWRISRYHSLKYRLLSAVRAGAFSELAALYDADDLAELFARIHHPELPARVEAAIR